VSRCLITGCEGFVGSHLADLLVSQGHDVNGSVYEQNTNLDHLAGQITVLKGDLTDRDWVSRIVDEVRPEFVFHLAAQSFVTVSWENPQLTLETNIIGSFHLLDLLQRSGATPTIVVVGSSSVYGAQGNDDAPPNELAGFKPTSMYAVSKVAEDMLGYFYATAYKMRLLRVRPFNMTGPRKTDDACSDFAKGIAEVESGTSEILEVGNLETIRDFTDGRDAVRAMWLVAERGQPGEVYNLCSGTQRRMREVLDVLRGLSTTEILYRVSPEKLRPFDDPISAGDNRKLLALGWRPEIPFETTMLDSLNVWRQRLG
jgi:GDP-4-dehydro-6-deoxy-D-mannose reductase